MDFAEDAQNLFRTQTHHAVTARMPPCLARAQDLHLGRSAHGSHQRLGIGLGVKHIHRTGCAVHVFRRGLTHQQTRQHQRLFTRLTASKDVTHFEQRQIRKAARLVTRRGLQQTGQQRRAHVAHFRRNRVRQHGCIITTAKQCGRGLVDKAVGDAFVVTQRSSGPAACLLTLLQRRQDRLGNARIDACQRFALKLG